MYSLMLDNLKYMVLKTFSCSVAIRIALGITLAVFSLNIDLISINRMVN